MLLTQSQFQKAAGISAVVAARWLEPLCAAASEFQINTPKRLAAFIAQVGHESGGFNTISENLYYSDAERVARIFEAILTLIKTALLNPLKSNLHVDIPVIQRKWRITFMPIRVGTVMKPPVMAGVIAVVG